MKTVLCGQIKPINHLPSMPNLPVQNGAISSRALGVQLPRLSRVPYLRSSILPLRPALLPRGIFIPLTNRRT